MSVEPETETESTGNAQLDERLSQPILRGDVGVDTAQWWISAFLIVVVGLLAWSSAMRVPFQAMDQQVVRDNEPMHSIVTVPDAAAVDGAPQLLATLTLALNWAAAPGSAGFMRFTGLVLHLLNGLLVFLLARRLWPKVAPVVAMLAGMLFVLHPLASQSVLYVSARGQLLAATLALASLLLFLRAVTNDAGVKPGPLAASLFCYIFAVFADPSAAILPAIILAAHGTVKDRARGGWRVHAPYWAALAALAVYAAAAHGLTGPKNLFALFAQYARMAVAPYGLSILHDAPALHWAAGLIVLAALAAVAALMLIRRSPGGLAVWWVALVLAVAAWHGAAVVEHRAYFALAGLALLAPWLYQLVQPRLKAVAGLAAAALVLFAAGASYMRIGVWRDELTLWQDAADKAPHSPQPLANLGRMDVILARAANNSQQALQAETLLRKAISLGGPEYIEPRLWLAAALQGMGEQDQALRTLYEVLGVDLNNRDAALAAANMLFDAGSQAADKAKLAEAVELYRKADAVAPLDAPALARLGAASSQLGHLEQAEDALKRAAQLAPDDQNLAQSLKNIEQARKRSAAIEQQAVALLRKNPREPAAMKLVAQANVMRGNALAASYALDAIWRADDADFQAWLLTGFVMARLGAPERFVSEHPNPPEKPADAAPAWTDLAKFCAGSAEWDAARLYLASEPAQAEQSGLPLVRLAEVAGQLGQPQRARAYLMNAAKDNPDNPEPWLVMANLAGKAKDAPAAANAIDEAEKRGAPPKKIQALRKKFGLENTGPVKTIIQ